jgi:hypothetical protein
MASFFYYYYTSSLAIHVIDFVLYHLVLPAHCPVVLYRIFQIVLMHLGSFRSYLYLICLQKYVVRESLRYLQILKILHRSYIARPTQSTPARLSYHDEGHVIRFNRMDINIVR